MSSDFPALTTQVCPDNINYWHPASPPEILHPEDQATRGFIDFKINHPAHIEPLTPLKLAIDDMHFYGLPFLLVTEKDTDTISGVVTGWDLQGDKPVEVSQVNRIPFDKITVSQVMTKTKDLVSADISALSNARVGHIIKTLKDNSAQILLITENDDKSQPFIRGLFSRSLLNRQLNYTAFIDN